MAKFNVNYNHPAYTPGVAGPHSSIPNHSLLWEYVRLGDLPWTSADQEELDRLLPTGRGSGSGAGPVLVVAVAALAAVAVCYGAFRLYKRYSA